MDKQKRKDKYQTSSKQQHQQPQEEESKDVALKPGVRGNPNLQAALKMKFNKKAEKHLSVNNAKLLQATQGQESVSKYPTEHVRPMENMSFHTTIKDSHAGLFSLNVKRIVDICTDSHSIQTNLQKRRYHHVDALNENSQMIRGSICGMLLAIVQQLLVTDTESRYLFTPHWQKVMSKTFVLPELAYHFARTLGDFNTSLGLCRVANFEQTITKLLDYAIRLKNVTNDQATTVPHQVIFDEHRVEDYIHKLNEAFDKARHTVQVNVQGQNMFITHQNHALLTEPPAQVQAYQAALTDRTAVNFNAAYSAYKVDPVFIVPDFDNFSEDLDQIELIAREASEQYNQTNLKLPVFKPSKNGNAHQIIRVDTERIYIPFPISEADIKHALIFRICEQYVHETSIERMFEHSQKHLITTDVIQHVLNK